MPSTVKYGSVRFGSLALEGHFRSLIGEGFNLTNDLQPLRLTKENTLAMLTVTFKISSMMRKAYFKLDLEI